MAVPAVLKADMTERERRQQPRVEVWIPALLTVLVPDKIELIQQRPVTVVDLSERGAMVSLSAEETFCSAILRESKSCRLSFGPSSGLPDNVVGKPVWGEMGTSPGQETRIGLFFENCPSEIRQALREYVAQVEAAPE